MKEINKEIIYVISAAVAALEKKEGSDLIVRSIRRIPQITPVWNIASRIII